MTVPNSARKRLAMPLKDTATPRRGIRTFHTVPIDERTWRTYAASLAATVETLSNRLDVLPDEFKAIEAWTIEILEHRRKAIALVGALEPFLPFDVEVAEGTLALVDEAMAVAAVALEKDAPIAKTIRLALANMGQLWRQSGPTVTGRNLAQIAFAVPTAPVDEDGRFRAEWVLQHYAYRNSGLVVGLRSHLVSLGVPHVTDLLGGISIVGAIVDSDDPIAAYVSMARFLDRQLTASRGLWEEIDAYLESQEPALRRAALIASRSYVAVLSQQRDSEERAFALVDAYKRTVEGPFRQYSWALYCMKVGVWRSPDMLTSLRDQLVAERDDLSAIVGDVIIPDLRNSETHENISWDGFLDEYVTQQGRVTASQVAFALVTGRSFVNGCEAGLAATRSLKAQLDTGALPSHVDAGRMPSWRRVRAFFGTNNLRLTEAILNTPNARFHVERLDQRDINPCLQALLLARRLLPRTETFSVATVGHTDPVLVVSARGLDATMPTWELALGLFDRMPLSTFLPANFDARLKFESEPLAARSIAWIAADDVLDAVDGSPDSWDARERELLVARLSVVRSALVQMRDVSDSGRTRFGSVQHSVEALRQTIAEDAPAGPDEVEAHFGLVRIRAQWETWGPVARHPAIAVSATHSPGEPRVGLKSRPRTLHFRTI